MAASTKTDCLSTKELVQTLEFAHLTPKMKQWVLTYVQNYIDHGDFDVLSATKKAYDCKNDESARVMGYELAAHPKILLALNRFFGISAKEAFLKQVERAVYNKKITIAQVQALELAARANGWTSGLPRHQDLRVKPPKSRAKVSKVTPADPLARVPEGATPLLNANGILRGYKTAAGEYVQLADVQAE